MSHILVIIAFPTIIDYFQNMSMLSSALEEATGGKVNGEGALNQATSNSETSDAKS